MISLAEVLSSTLPQSSDWQTNLARNWQCAVGDLASRMRLERVKDKLLIVGVYDSHWISELFMLAPRIIEKINNFLGAPYVTQIRFVIANPKQKISKKQASNGEVLRPRAPMNARQEQVLASIKDGQLHDALEKFFYACVR